MQRKIYKSLLDWKTNDNKPLIVLGARQVGKTYIIEKFCKKEFKHTKTINLLYNQNIIDLYKSNISSIEKFKQLKTIINFEINKDSILFVDEVQESEEFISDLKFLNETYPELKLILAGSLLGIKLKRSKKPFPVGKVSFLNMYPMDFEEFLIAKNRFDLIDLIKEHLTNNKQVPQPIHDLLINIYQEYLMLGGMPENIKNYINNNEDINLVDKNILDNIRSAYINDMNRYIKSDAESMKIRKIYNSIPLQLTNASRKFQFGKVESGAKSTYYGNSLNWLEESGLVNISYSINNPIKPIKAYQEENVFKVYMNDIGLLNRSLNITHFDIINNALTIYKGVITENYVSQQLISNNIPLYYWRSNNTAEIDFLLENKDGVIPIEVKASDNKKSKSLNNYIQKYNPKYAIRITTKNFGFDKEKGIKSIPLYAACFINTMIS